MMIMMRLLNEDDNKMQSNSLFAGIIDGASVNKAATKTVMVVYPKVVDVRCFSHAVDDAGEHFTTSTASFSCGTTSSAIAQPVDSILRVHTSSAHIRFASCDRWLMSSVLLVTSLS